MNTKPTTLDTYLGRVEAALDDLLAIFDGQAK